MMSGVNEKDGGNEVALLVTSCRTILCVGLGVIINPLSCAFATDHPLCSGITPPTPRRRARTRGCEVRWWRDFWDMQCTLTVKLLYEMCCTLTTTNWFLRYATHTWRGFWHRPMQCTLTTMVWGGERLNAVHCSGHISDLAVGKGVDTGGGI